MILRKDHGPKNLSAKFHIGPERIPCGSVKVLYLPEHTSFWSRTTGFRMEQIVKELGCLFLNVYFTHLLYVCHSDSKWLTMSDGDDGRGMMMMMNHKMS